MRVIVNCVSGGDAGDFVAGAKMARRLQSARGRKANCAAPLFGLPQLCGGPPERIYLRQATFAESFGWWPPGSGVKECHLRPVYRSFSNLRRV